MPAISWAGAGLDIEKAVAQIDDTFMGAFARAEKAADA